MFVKKWPLHYQKVIKTNLTTYLWDSSDSSDIRESGVSSDGSDSSDNSDSSDSTDPSQFKSTTWSDKVGVNFEQKLHPKIFVPTSSFRYNFEFNFGTILA